MSGLVDGDSGDISDFLTIVDIPEVAVVDAVVKHGDGLGSGLANDLASGGSLGIEVEELVIRVLLVVGESLRPDVDISLVLVDGVRSWGVEWLWAPACNHWHHD